MPASGHQNHTTSPSASAPFVSAAFASIASRPAFVTIAIRPSVGRDGAVYNFDLGQARTELFLQIGLDSPNQIDPVQQIPLWAQARSCTGHGLENVNRLALFAC